MEKTLYEVLDELRQDSCNAAIDYANRGQDEVCITMRDAFSRRMRAIEVTIRELPAEVLERVAE